MVEVVQKSWPRLAKSERLNVRTYGELQEHAETVERLAKRHGSSWVHWNSSESAQQEAKAEQRQPEENAFPAPTEKRSLSKAVWHGAWWQQGSRGAEATKNRQGVRESLQSGLARSNGDASTCSRAARVLNEPRLA